jgi:hypothetical protein
VTNLINLTKNAPKLSDMIKDAPKSDKNANYVTHDEFKNKSQANVM